MEEIEWATVPVGVDAQRWQTVRTRRTVLVVVHTLVSGQRLLDVVGLVESDPRVQVLYTRAPDVFGGGVDRFLAGVGAFRIPWAQAVRERFDLVLAASSGGLERVHGPLVLLPHGAAYGKRTGAGGPVYGLDAARLVRDGRVLPSALVLSHERQREVLADQCPQAVDAALVAGDPCYDRMIASSGLRARYRAALGVRPGRELVVVTSTWGASSLVREELPLYTRLVRELDPCRYQVAATVHPAVWFGHGERQLRSWLAQPLARGLVLVEPEQDWRPAVIAADHVITDHGSTGVYAAAIGKPVLVTGSPADGLDPASPQALLAESAPRWTPRRRVGRQFHQADPDLAAAVAARLTSHPRGSHRLLRERLYELLDLPLTGKHRGPEQIPVPVRVSEGRNFA
ncbi:hypothetical protein [Actinokineospora globicatena]|uniref:CDP-Glycerol:Poly(Glycerophosphate) glycerophosphotransferase n=1 Tax=Actinokineospora globicatena TaxID=103729 RepID=A0A9W6QL27_9PSEU|nr:hypothetical protein [Actinokineospora globicatena]GLW92423.1 hypothetical protein Aglo03_32390 [Actinokineospora globicatena]